MNRVINFSAGPATLPAAVLEKARDELLCYGETGVSVMEMSHRTKMFENILNDTSALLKELLHIPENYKILYMAGGATQQFASVPMNLAHGFKNASYAVTGEFAKKAADEAKAYLPINIAADSSADKYNHVPAIDVSALDKDTAYLHITTNNTVFGTHYSSIPDTGSIPLVADMSSNILGEEMDITKFAAVYAGAQKNIGLAGVTIAIVRDDMLERKANPLTPTTMMYSKYAKEGMYNTPATYSIYMCKLVFEWIKGLGGVAAIEAINKQKAALLYDAIDKSAIFKGNVKPESRSIMNVTFSSGNEDTDKRFLEGAAKEGMINLKGHRATGGIRASIYNAMDLASVKVLADYINNFKE